MAKSSFSNKRVVNFRILQAKYKGRFIEIKKPQPVEVNGLMMMKDVTKKIYVKIDRGGRVIGLDGTDNVELINRIRGRQWVSVSGLNPELMETIKALA